MSYEFAGNIGFVVIHHHRLDIVHIEAKRVSKKEDQKQGDGKGQVETAKIPDEMIELLAGYGPYVSEVQWLIPPRVISVTNASFRSASERPGQAVAMISWGLPEATIFPSFIITMRSQ